MTKIVKKPWGEECWLELNERYCFKRIFIKAGHRTSLQYHENKLETNFVVRGKAELQMSTTQEQAICDYSCREIIAGDHVTIQPGTRHRITAITNLELLEVSTPEVDDVIRLIDDTGRGSGKIESEHVS